MAHRSPLPPVGGPPNSGVVLPLPTAIVSPEPDPADAWQLSVRTLAHYERLEQIGEGTYGQVYRARCRDSNRIVALKKMRIHHGGYWGMPLQLIREIKILKRLQHPNLLRMIEVVTSKGVEHLDEEDNPKQKSLTDRVHDVRESYKGNLFLVLEYLSHDLTGLMDVAYEFTEVQIKCIFRQLLEALAYMHEQKYVHRDIKSSNILMDSHFRLKLADFGLARCLEPPLLEQLSGGTSLYNSHLELTNKVITLWYRPPEILLGATNYGPAVDVWSSGCILAELLLGKPLFPGKAELDQLGLILDLLGTPSKETWESLSTLKRVRSGEMNIEISENKPSKLRKYAEAKNINPTACNLLEKLLEWDPRRRMTARNALEHRYFWTQPVAPKDPAELGEIRLGGNVADGSGHFHEFQTKKKRRLAKAAAEEAKERAKFEGATDEAAQAEFDRVYRFCMKKVANEGVSSSTLADVVKPLESEAEESRKHDTKPRRQEDRVHSESGKRHRESAGHSSRDGSERRHRRSVDDSGRRRRRSRDRESPSSRSPRDKRDKVAEMGNREGGNAEVGAGQTGNEEKGRDQRERSEAQTSEGSIKRKRSKEHRRDRKKGKRERDREVKEKDGERIREREKAHDSDSRRPPDSDQDERNKGAHASRHDRVHGHWDRVDYPIIREPFLERLPDRDRDRGWDHDRERFRDRQHAPAEDYGPYGAFRDFPPPFRVDGPHVFHGRDGRPDDFFVRHHEERHLRVDEKRTRDDERRPRVDDRRLQDIDKRPRSDNRRPRSDDRRLDEDTRPQRGERRPQVDERRSRAEDSHPHSDDKRPVDDDKRIREDERYLHHDNLRAREDDRRSRDVERRRDDEWRHRGDRLSREADRRSRGDEKQFHGDDRVLRDEERRPRGDDRRARDRDRQGRHRHDDWHREVDRRHHDGRRDEHGNKQDSNGRRRDQR